MWLLDSRCQGEAIPVADFLAGAAVALFAVPDSEGDRNAVLAGELDVILVLDRRLRMKTTLQKPSRQMPLPRTFWLWGGWDRRVEKPRALASSMEIGRAHV